MNVMDDINERFRRLDGLAVPDLWNEATVRAADPDEVARRSLPDLDSGPMSYAVHITLAAAAVVAVAFLGINLLFTEGGNGVGGPTAAPSSISSPIPSPTPMPLEPSPIDVGFIGLPPPGAAPSTPESGELVTSFVYDRQPPFNGMARLYADGRLIWFRYDIGNEPYSSTGYLEQRLTPEGVELVRALAGEPVDGDRRLDPRTLPDQLPANAWADITVRPYVPSGFAACLMHENWEDPFQESTLTLPEKLAVLPAAAAGILRDREEVPSDSYGATSHCLGMTTAEARLLDAALRNAELEQDEWRNRYLLEYHIVLDSAAPDAWRLGVWFEPILPDGTIGCTSCG